MPLPTPPSNLFEAAKKGDASAALMMLQRRDADLNAVDGLANAPLHYACGSGHARVARLLVNNGAEVDKKGENGLTPLMMAVRGCKERSLLEFLVDHGASTSARGAQGETLLHVAASEGNVAGMRFALDRGVDANVADADGRTPAHVAAWWNDAAAPLEFLVRNGANLRKKDRRGQNALHWAARGGHAAVVDFVLRHRSDDYVGEVGHTSAPVDVEERDVGGNTALDLARASTTEPSVEVISLLRDRLRQRLVNCAFCEQHPAHVLFRPCGHRVACAPCSLAWKKCPECKTVIAQREDLGLMAERAVERVAEVGGSGGTERPSTASLNVRTKSALVRQVQELSRTCSEMRIRSEDDEERRREVESEREQMRRERDRLKEKEVLATRLAATAFQATAMASSFIHSFQLQMPSQLLQQPEQETPPEVAATPAAVASTCAVCLDGDCGVAFECGHLACRRCAKQLTECHFCRRKIGKRIYLYT